MAAKRNKWQRYEQKKRELSKKQLSCSAYEKAIKQLCGKKKV